MIFFNTGEIYSLFIKRPSGDTSRIAVWFGKPDIDQLANEIKNDYYDVSSTPEKFNEDVKELSKRLLSYIDEDLRRSIDSDDVSSFHQPNLWRIVKETCLIGKSNISSKTRKLLFLDSKVKKQ